MMINDMLVPGILILSILLGSWKKWNILSVYGRDNRKVYIAKMMCVLVVLVIYPFIAAEYDPIQPGSLFFWGGAGIISAIIYVSTMRRAEDIIHFSLAQKIILFIIVPIFGSYIEVIDLLLDVVIVLLMVWPGRKDEVTHVDRQS